MYGGGAIFLIVLFVAAAGWLVWSIERCKHSWVLLKEIENIRIDEIDESIRTLTHIVYIHECTECKKIKRQKVKVR